MLLNVQLNDVIYYDSERVSKKELQSAQDRNAEDFQEFSCLEGFYLGLGGCRERK